MDIFRLTPSRPGKRALFGLNTSWGFKKGQLRSPSRAAVGGETDVILPHTWNDKDTFQKGIRYYQGPGWYQRSFTLPDINPSETTWRLVTEGFHGAGDVWLNGHRLAKIDGQYLGIDLPVNDLLHSNESNDLVVRLSNAYRPDVLPGKKQPDFHIYGGLSGRCYLMQLALLHFDHRDLQLVCHNPLEKSPDVQFFYSLTNVSSTSSRCTVRATLTGPDGKPSIVAEEKVEAAPHSNARQKLSFEMGNPKRWDVDQPHLYEIELSLFVDGKTVDALRERFGIRQARFDGQLGFVLNGNRVALHGVNRHESMPGFGNALPEFLHREDAEQIKGLGFNFVRLSHYPQHPAFLHACDEIGLVVCAELATWKSVRRGRWLAAAERQLNALLERDRNHPSIVTWCIGNESRSRKAFMRLDRLVEEKDGTRPSLYAENHLDRGQRGRTLKLTGLLGVNYEIDKLEEAHQQSRDGAIVVTEMSNSPRSYRGDTKAEKEQIERFERDLRHLEGKPYCAGYALWSFCDYATQRKHRYRRDPGVVDCWRIPKMSAAYMQARNLSTPFLAVFGDWSMEGKTERAIHIMTNLDTIECFSGGEHLKSFTGSRYYDAVLPFTSEPLRVEGTGGTGTAKAVLFPFGEPVALQIHQTPCATRHDVLASSWLTVQVVDDEGRHVRNWNGKIRIDVQGPGRAVVMGEEPMMNVASGLGRVVVTGEPGGEVIVTCSADNLQPASNRFRWSEEQKKDLPEI